MSVQVTDRGASYVFRRAAQLANKTTFSVGVPPNAGEYPSGRSVADVAAVHEFGLGNNPSRSFLRGWYDGKGINYFAGKLTEIARDAILKGVNFNTALGLFGDQCVAEVRARMDAHISPALQKTTIQRKEADGSSTPETPLENTGRLRAAIKWEIT